MSWDKLSEINIKFERDFCDERIIQEQKGLKMITLIQLLIERFGENNSKIIIKQIVKKQKECSATEFKEYLEKKLFLLGQFKKRR